MKKKTLKLFSLLTLLMLVGCFLQFNTSEAASKPKLSKTKLELEIGKTAKLTLKKAKGKVIWSSSNSSIASVNKSGLVTAKGAGETIITAKNNKKKYACTVDVNPPKTNSISFANATLSIVASQSAQISFSVDPINSAEAKDLTWTSSDTSIATVSDGIVTGVKPGQATITAAKDGVSASCDITIMPGFYTDIKDKTIQYKDELQAVKNEMTLLCHREI